MTASSAVMSCMPATTALRYAVFVLPDITAALT
jgi:hypothetical protein